MRRLVLLGICFCLALSAPSLAQSGENFVLDFELVYAKSPLQRRIYDTSSWLKDAQAGRHTALESGRTVGLAGQDSLGHLGSKRPMVYYDPRVGASQVQYTDLGLKADWKPVPLGNGLIEIDIRTEKGQQVQPDLPTSTVFLQEAKVHLKRGQTAVLASTRGVLTAKYFEKLYPDIKFDEDSVVMLVISLR